MLFSEQNNPKFSYYCIVLISAVFFAGYFLLKCPLAFILHKQHIPLLQAYSITTTANILMAVVSVALGILLKDNTNQKFLLFLGIFISTMALILLKITHLWVLILGVGFYVIGGSLYFFNIIIYINKLLSSAKDRQVGNFTYQIWINLGALIGGILFILEYSNSTKLNEYSLWACLASLLFFILTYKKLNDEKLILKKTIILLSKIFILFLFILACLFFDSATRWIALIAFIIAASYGLYHAKKIHSENYFTLILLVIFFSVPYWLGYTILYNEFFHLLDKSSYKFYNLSSDIIILLDPVTNILFGLLVLKLYQKYTYTMMADLNTGMVLLISSFVILSVGLSIANTPLSLSPIYPIICIFLFSCGEFLIQSTLNASVRNLLSNQENISFGMGILRSSRASASALGFFFMWLTVRDGLNQNDLISTKEPKLYILTAAYILCSLILYQMIKRKR